MFGWGLLLNKLNLIYFLGTYIGAKVKKTLQFFKFKQLLCLKSLFNVFIDHLNN
jgi:hypothetical protein